MMNSPDLDTTNILIIEPDVTLARAATNFLAAFGYSVSHAYNEDEALEIAHRLFPKMVVLDIGVPEPQGIEFLNTLRGLGASVNPYVAVTSIYSLTRSALRSNGIDAFLQKPYDMRNLLLTVQNGIALVKDSG